MQFKLNGLVSALTHLPSVRPVRYGLRGLSKFAAPGPIRTAFGYTVDFTGHYMQRTAISGDYEPDTIDVLRRFARGTVIDVGAHQGFIAMALAQTSPRVIACEPNPITLARLKANLALNPQLPITIVEAAISDKASTMDLWVTNGGHENGSLIHYPDVANPRQLPNANYAVAVTTLDSLEVPGHVTLIKVDTEGNEYEALLGASNLIATHRPAICFEMSMSVYMWKARSAKDIMEFFSGRNYRVTQIQDDGTLKDFVGFDRRVDNLIALPK